MGFRFQQWTIESLLSHGLWQFGHFSSELPVGGKVGTRSRAPVFGQASNTFSGACTHTYCKDPVELKGITNCETGLIPDLFAWDAPEQWHYSRIWLKYPHQTWWIIQLNHFQRCRIIMILCKWVYNLICSYVKSSFQNASTWLQSSPKKSKQSALPRCRSEANEFTSDDLLESQLHV